MKIAIGRLKRIPKVFAFMLTRENHINGWPHLHGVGWFPKNENNAATLFGGRLYDDLEYEYVDRKHQALLKGYRKGWSFNELGKCQIDLLRDEPYKDKSGKEWRDWFEYIVKDQDVKWKSPNAFWQTQDLTLYFPPQTQDLVD